MTLFETGESSGAISLSKILNEENYDIDGIMSDLKLENLFFAACRGGWPRCMALTKDTAKLEIAKDYYRQIYQKDISAIDGTNRNPEWPEVYCGHMPEIWLQQLKEKISLQM